MKTITVDRPSDWTRCEVHCFADVHIGDLMCDGNLLKELVKRCEETENCVVILNGDLCNNAVKSGKSDIYSESIRPMEQMQRVVDIFGKLAEQKKIIALTDGNHERRTYRNDGVDLSQIIATQLGVPYSPGAAFIFLRFGRDAGRMHHHRKVLYTMYINHGSGGGKMVGGKANRLVSMGEVIDADVYFHSHTHEPIIVKRGFYRTSTTNSSLSYVERLFVNTAAYMDYGGYAEQMEYAPSAKSTPIVFLDGTRRKMDAIL